MPNPNAHVRLALLAACLAMAACATPAATDPQATGGSGGGSVSTKKSPSPKSSGSPKATPSVGAGTTGATASPSAAPSGTPNPSATASATASPTATPVGAGTPTPTATPAATPTPTPAATATPAVTTIATPAPNLPAGDLKVETFAGTGTAGFSKDPVALAAATFNKPRGLALGPDGAIYVADAGNHAIRKIKDGMVTTVIGTGVTTTQADTVTLNAPSDLAVDTDGTLYIADTLNNRIRKLRPGASEMDFLAGNGGAGFLNGTGDGAQVDNPTGVALDGKGNLWIVDASNNAIRRVKTATGELTTLAGKKGEASLIDGAGTAARFAGPNRCFALGEALFVADAGNDCVRKVMADGTTSTVANASLALQGASSVVSTADGSLLVLGAGSLRILKFTAPAASTTVFSNVAGAGFKDGPIAEAQFSSLDDLLVLPTGEILIADATNHRIRKIKP